MVEKLRRILTLYGFERDLDLTLEDIDFKALERKGKDNSNYLFKRTLMVGHCLTISNSILNVFIN